MPLCINVFNVHRFCVSIDIGRDWLLDRHDTRRCCLVECMRRWKDNIQIYINLKIKYYNNEIYLIVINKSLNDLNQL
jgi:hypothetical protein